MYQVDPSGDIVIKGFEKGIGASPYSGLTDLRNMNLISVPGEAGINFTTSNITSGAVSGTMTSASGSIATYTGGTGLEDYMAIYFTSTGSYSGFSTATPYWISKSSLSSSTFAVYTNYQRTTSITITGSGSAAFKVFQIGITPDYVSGTTNFLAGGIKYFASPQGARTSTYQTYGVDAAGLVWGNLHTTTSGYWTYTGNSIVDGNGVQNASGNGLVYWRVTNGNVGAGQQTVDYLFVFRNTQIDYFIAATYNGGPTLGTWTSGWVPATVGSFTQGQTGQANYLSGSNSHDAIVHYDGRVYFCDGYNVQKFYQTAQTTLFNPTDATTFTGLTFNLLPIDDESTCLSSLGNNIIIGAQNNVVYQWNTTANLVSNYIPLAEPYTSHIVTVNTNAYIFAGNRGRIYITNGSQANIWKKIPDHLSNTLNPKYQWGGATSVKNQLYFSFQAFDDANNVLTCMGGLWAIDLDTQALRLTNQLSYGTYAGYASALIAQLYNPLVSVTNSGTSLYIGWQNGYNNNDATLCGIDQPTSPGNVPYTGGQAYVVSDAIPIGTNLKPITATQVEFKLSAPLLTGESIQLLIGSALASNTNPTFTSLGTVSGDGSLVSGNLPLTVQGQQWSYIKAVSTGISSNPSLNRLTELRIIGATTQQTGISNLV